MITSVKKLGEELNEVRHLRNDFRPRYHQFGVGRIVGYFLFLMYFTLLPYTLKKIWPYIFVDCDIIPTYVITLLAINLGVFAIYNPIMYLIYVSKHPFFEQYRNSDKPWHWEEDQQEWRKMKKKTFQVLAINFLVVMPIMMGLGSRTALRMDFTLQNWPSTFELVWQFIVCLLAQDLLFYFFHRLLHHPMLYWIHKIHHQYRQSFSLSAHSMHPLDYVLSGTLPSSVGFQILGVFTKVHFSTVIVWAIFRLIHGYQIHNGYTFTWSTQSLIPYTVTSDHHHFHHSMNAGNYGSIFLFWDAIFQTETPFIKYLSDQVSKKHKQQEDQAKSGKKAD